MTKGMPWWGWLIVAIVFVNVVNSSGNSFFPLVIFGMIAFAALNRSKRGDRGRVGHPPPPSSAGPRPVGGPADQPQDSPSTGPLPRIDVPEYPTSPGGGYSGGTPGTGGGRSTTTGAGATNDPVISLAQLHLSRLGRELHDAATRASMIDVTRLLAEIGDLATRMTAMVAGTHGLPDSGRREFESGLRRLEREVSAAKSETQPGPRVSRVVQTCGSMGQTGRYE